MRREPIIQHPSHRAILIRAPRRQAQHILETTHRQRRRRRSAARRLLAEQTARDFVLGVVVRAGTAVRVAGGREGIEAVDDVGLGREHAVPEIVVRFEGAGAAVERSAGVGARRRCVVGERAVWAGRGGEVGGARGVAVGEHRGRDALGLVDGQVEVEGRVGVGRVDAVDSLGGTGSEGRRSRGGSSPGGGRHVELIVTVGHV